MRDALSNHYVTDPDDPLESSKARAQRERNNAKCEADEIYSEHGIRIPWPIVRDGLTSAWWRECQRQGTRYLTVKEFNGEEDPTLEQFWAGGDL